MIEIEKARRAFHIFLDRYRGRDVPGFQLKVAHTAHVAGRAKELAAKLGLSGEDLALAELIALLHDIGRFDEIDHTGSFDGAGFDHAAHGVKLLFEDNLIRDFIADSSYDAIIKNAIANHSGIAIADGLDGRSLLHAKIIRDADKLDNFRVKRDEAIEAIFPGRVSSREDMERSTVSDKVYAAAVNGQSVDIHDRITPLDCWVCILAFVYDLNFRESYEIVEADRYIDILIGRFCYHDAQTRARMERIQAALNDFVRQRAHG